MDSFKLLVINICVLLKIKFPSNYAWSHGYRSKKYGIIRNMHVIRVHQIQASSLEALVAFLSIAGNTRWYKILWQN